MGVYRRKGEGRIILRSGPMCSDKTSDLIRFVKNLRRLNLECQVFKPRLDTRYSENKVVTHDGESLPAIAVSSPSQILGFVNAKTKVVAIDEVNLFVDWHQLVKVALALADKGITLFLSGLDTDYRKNPFEWFLHIKKHALVIHKTATCAQCGKPACYSQRLSTEEQVIVPGGLDKYEPRCEDCHYIPRRGSLSEPPVPDKIVDNEHTRV